MKIFKMKALKKFALVGLVFPLLFLLSPLAAQGKIAEKEIVIIRLQEAEIESGGASHILISEKGKIREIKLEKFGRVTTNTKNLEVISNLLNEYLQNGFKIESTSGISGVGIGLTTYILTK